YSQLSEFPLQKFSHHSLPRFSFFVVFLPRCFSDNHYSLPKFTIRLHPWRHNVFVQTARDARKRTLLRLIWSFFQLLFIEKSSHFQKPLYSTFFSILAIALILRLKPPFVLKLS